ncbi:MAG TPA: NADH-quinone oxidoreductase subunit J, partial [Deinococcales bacterium]|nr:NADH-quinone oxidoreductase subunit J [Deinococcales bacterium]
MVTFVILAAVMVATALGVLLFREPVHVALSLVGTFLALAATYVTLEAHFLAAIQVIVYTGAIMVLFLFTIMLLNVRDADRQRRFRWLPAAVLGIAVLVLGAIVTTVVLEPKLLPGAEVIVG